MPVAELRARLAALHPEPWPPDRAAATAALQGWNRDGTAVVYLGDGLADGADFPRFATALSAIGAVTELCCDTTPARVLLPPDSEADRLVARVAQAAPPPPRRPPCWRRAATAAPWPARRSTCPRAPRPATAALLLPPEVRNRLSRLVLEGRPPPPRSCCWTSAGAAARSACSPATQTAADTPFAGAALLPAPRAGAVHRTARRHDLTTPAARRDLRADPGRPALAGGARTRRADRLGRAKAAC